MIDLRMYRIGVDVGGTFTDFTVLAAAEDGVWFFKVPSTPHDPSAAIEAGLKEIIGTLGIDPGAISHLGHGSTVATNMIIERRGAPTGLLTTKGFRDVLEIGRQTRPHLYDYGVRKPPPLVARKFRLEADERIMADGTVLVALDVGALEESIRTLAANGIKSVAICFLHSYRNPLHEQQAKAAVERLMPGTCVSASCEVLPEFREFERMSTTVLNAYIGPRMQNYLDRFIERIAALGIAIAPTMIHSNGGLLSVGAVRKFPARTCLSGPAAGVVGAAAVGNAIGMRDLVTFDVGGTSTDVSLVEDGRPLFTSNRTVADYPIKCPMIDIQVIGAGGGSIGWIDEGGALKVGPRSAGADPGPAAYGRGGRNPTLTDANIVLRRLNPRALLGGRMPVSYDKAHRAIGEHIARPLGIPVEVAAHGIVRIANANMSRAIRSVSTERGRELRHFALFAYGGAGALHAAEVAQECGIDTIIVPQEPGTMCARGILLSPVSLDFVQTEIAPANCASWHRVAAIFDDMRRRADAFLAQDGVAASDRTFVRHVEARYLGQNHEVVVDVDEVTPDGLDVFLANFRHAHARAYGYDIPDRPIEIVNCRLQAIGAVPHPPLEAPSGGAALEDAMIERREAYFGETSGYVETPVYRRDKLPRRAAVTGPAIIEEMSATTLILPGQAADLDCIGNIVVRLARATDRKGAA